MKRHSTFLLVILLVTCVMGSGTMIAHATDDITIAPASGTTRGVDSGFVDDNGNPISEADYQKLVDKSKENIVQRNPVVATIVLAAVAVGAVSTVVLIIRSKRKV